MNSEELLKRMLKREEQYKTLVVDLTADVEMERNAIHRRTLTYRRGEINSMYLRHVEERKALERKIARNKAKKETKGN